MILHGDLFDVLPTLDAESVDASVTDPPYGIGFMGREWDTFKPSAMKDSNKFHQVDRSRANHPNPNLRNRVRSPALSPSQIDYDFSSAGLRGFQEWTTRWAAEVLRVLKPGAHILVCGAPRSFHRMTCGLEDAGFVVRDCFSWLYGQGFPKSLNLGDGKGTALKPGWEPIVLARKPFKGSVSGNVEKFGTGALNIDACRIEADGFEPKERLGATKLIAERPWNVRDEESGTRKTIVEGNDLGRWPANVLLDEEAAAMLDEQTGELTSGFMAAGTIRNQHESVAMHRMTDNACSRDTFADSGGASRFYYVAKPSREERDYGCHGEPTRSAGECTDRREGSAGLASPRAGAGRTHGAKNFHPTVKPVELMRWLVKLVTPLGGTVLDPFMGSGTTGMACRYELREFIGIERASEYVQIAERRIAAVAPLFAEPVA